MARLVLHQSPGFGIVCPQNQIPDPPFWIAEPGEGAQIFLIGE
jgi:hypothetical protein